MENRNPKTNANPKSSERTASKWLKAVWKDIKPILLVMLGAGTLALGTIGFQQVEILKGESPRLIDCFYRSLSLFGFGAGDVDQPIPWQMEVARWSGPLATIIAAFWGLFTLFRQQVQLLGLRFSQKHVIVCGSGRKGLLLAQSLRKAGRRVVVIDDASQNPQVDSCRESGAIVIVGDARDPYTLLKAGVRRASHLVALCGDDSTNIEVLVQAREMAVERSEELNLIAHIDDLQFYSMARMQEFMTRTRGVRTEFFNTADAWARAALRCFAIPTVQAPQLLLVGMNDTAERLILHAAREWIMASKKDKLAITIADEQGETKTAAFSRKYSLVEETCQFSVFPYSPTSLEFERGDFLEGTPQPPQFSHCFVCLLESSPALNAGLTLTNLFRHEEMHILVRLNGEPGLSKMLKVIKCEGKAILQVLDCLDNVYTQDLVEYGSHEMLARVIHEEYVKEQIRLGATPNSLPALLPWEQLPEEYRNTNRRQADGIGDKLAAAGCTISPWVHSGAEQFTFTPVEIEMLARLEHKRWCKDKISHGWSYGPDRDETKKLHPSLISWGNPHFSDAEKQKDRDTIVRIPRYLALAGFEILRLGKSSSTGEENEIWNCLKS